MSLTNVLSIVHNRHHYLPFLVLLLNVILFLIAIVSLLIRDAKYQPSVIRCVLSILIPSVMATRGLKKKSVDLSGALAGVMVAISMVLSSYVATIALITCYLATSKATRTGEEIKRQFEVDFKKGGQRNWIQVISNLGVANIAILLRFILYGAGEIRLDFLHQENYWNSWLLLSALMSISAALGDTFSSELGPVFTGPNIEPLLITTLRRVPRGTNGGVTIDGFVAACLGGFSIGLCSYLSIILMIPTAGFWATTPGNIQSTPQWPLLHFSLYSGLLGSALDSLMGATLQYTGYDRQRRRVIEQEQLEEREHNSIYVAANAVNNVEHITGLKVLDNHEVNLLMTAIMAILMPFIATPLWPFGFGDGY